MRNCLKIPIIFLLISLSYSQQYTKFPYTIEAEDCEGAGDTWTSVYEKKIKGMYTGKGFAYLQGNTFSFEVTVPEDGMYQFTARMAQILTEEGRLQTISINDIDYSYTVPYYDTWTDFDFGMHRLNKGTNTIKFKPIYGYAEYDSITVSEAEFPDFSKISTKLSDPKATKSAQELQEYLALIKDIKSFSREEVFDQVNQRYASRVNTDIQEKPKVKKLVRR